MNDLCTICGKPLDRRWEEDEIKQSDLCQCDKTLSNEELEFKISKLPGGNPFFLVNSPFAIGFLDEVAALHDQGWEIQVECSTFDGLDDWAWRVWIERFTDDCDDMRNYPGTAQTFARAVYLAYLRYKLGTNADQNNRKS